MSRTSRIPHPPGTRYVPIYAWACDRFGLAGAAVIGLLEFLDRAEDLPGQPTASRARIIADLQGIVGRNAVDAALTELGQAGAIQRHVEVEPSINNITRTVRYGLDVAGMARLLGTPEIGSPQNSRNRESPKLPEPVPKSGLPSIEEEKEKEAAAPCSAKPSNTAGAAAAEETKRRHPRRTPSGIEIWYSSEDALAAALEASAPSDQVRAAVVAIRARPNASGKPTSPVPALVGAEIDRQRHERDIAARRAATEASLHRRDQYDFDPAAQAQGARMLASVRAKIGARHG